jgi:hypothetical protein
MSIRDTGSYIGYNRVTSTSQDSASGIWSLSAAERRVRASAWPLVVVTDPDFSNVSLLLHFDGSNNSTTFTDSSLANRTATAVGDAKISTAQSKFGGSSLLVDGDGDYVSFPDSDDLDFGAGDFTIEAWVRLAAHPTSYAGAFQAGIVSKDSSSTSGWYLNVGGSGSESLILNLSGSDGSRQEITATANLSLSTWYHVAAVREGNLIYIYRDGTLLNSGGTSYTKTLTNSTTTLKVGAVDYDITYQYLLNGNVDDVRITKGVARYPGGTTFTPPTAAFPDTGPAFTPNSIGSLAFWGSASDESLFTLSGSTVTEWRDRAGGELKLSSTVGAPTRTASAVNSLPAVTFDGDDAIYGELDASLANSEPFTLFAVVRPTSTTTSEFSIRPIGYGGQSSGDLAVFLQFRPYAASSPSYSFGGLTTKVMQGDYNPNIVGSSLAVATKFLAMTYDGTDVALYENGTLVGTQTNVRGSLTGTNATAAGLFQVGGQNEGGSFSFFGKMHVSECGVYQKALTPTEVLSLHNYFDAIYSTE